MFHLETPQMSGSAKIAYLGMVLAFASMHPATACDVGARGVSASPESSGFETVIPISVESGEVIVDVTINGRGPFPMMFDTGSVEAESGGRRCTRA